MKRSQYMGFVIWIMWYCSIVLIFVSGLLPHTSFLRFVFQAFFICAFSLRAWFNKCPHCGRFGLRMRFLRDDRGYCSYCGELAEFEE